jgi:hypothetical protein
MNTSSDTKRLVDSSSHANKKIKLSFSEEESTQFNGDEKGVDGNNVSSISHPPPSPSVSPSLASSSVIATDDGSQAVTIAMLRALSKSVLKQKRSRT